MRGRCGLALLWLAAVQLKAEPSCGAEREASFLPVPSTSAVVRPIDSMHVIRTATAHPFWMALPTEQATPGYLSNSARDTRIMNPSGSVLVHQILGGRDGACSRRDPATGRRPLVVDVGAHVGWFSALAASYGCRVLSFEPQPHAHPFLNATITLNGWTERWRSVWGAVSSGEAGGARMKMVNRHGWDNWDVTELVPLEDPDDGDEVPVWRLDDLVREDVALLKIDAEGHEDYVVASAASLLANHKVGAILVEAKGGGGDDRDAFKREWFATLTESQGYYPYEFYEEVGRSVYSWSLAEHLFPIHPPREFAGWPANQVFEDHLFSRAPLALPLPGTVSVQYPPMDHVYSDATKVAIVVATYNFSIPAHGMLQIDVNGRMASLVNESEAGTAQGEMLRTYTLIMPQLPDGDYVIDVLVLYANGHRVEHEGGTYSTTFVVDSSAPPFSKAASSALVWHCQRFLAPPMCE